LNGTASYKKAGAAYYLKRFGVDLDPETETLSLIGSKEGLFHLEQSILNPGDTIIIPNPGYPVYRAAARIAGADIFDLPLHPENGYLPDFAYIPEEIARKAKILWLNYPNNPTAAVAGREFFRETVDYAKDNGIIVCHDAPYSEIAYDGYRAPSFLETPGAKEVGVEFHSLSKTYNMTGWRIGFAVGNPEVIAGLGKIKENVDSGAFQAVQEAGIEALSGPQDSIAKHVKVFRERRDIMVDGLNDLGFDVKKPKATFYLWFRIPMGYKTSAEFASDMLDRAGVVMTPGTGFGRYGEGYVRCALTQPRERLEEALSRIKK